MHDFLVFDCDHRVSCCQRVWRVYLTLISIVVFVLPHLLIFYGVVRSGAALLPVDDWGRERVIIIIPCRRRGRRSWRSTNVVISITFYNRQIIFSVNFMIGPNIFRQHGLVVGIVCVTFEWYGKCCSFVRKCFPLFTYKTVSRIACILWAKFKNHNAFEYICKEFSTYF